MGTVNDNGNMSSFINCVFGQTLNARGSNTNFNGCTVVELKAAHLKTLSAGTHILSVVSRNGQADITFTIEKERKNNSPKTGENNDVVMWIALLFISSGVMTGIGAVKKSKKKK